MTQSQLVITIYIYTYYVGLNRHIFVEEPLVRHMWRVAVSRRTVLPDHTALVVC